MVSAFCIFLYLESMEMFSHVMLHKPYYFTFHSVIDSLPDSAFSVW